MTYVLAQLSLKLRLQIVHECATLTVLTITSSDKKLVPLIPDSDSSVKLFHFHFHHVTFAMGGTCREGVNSTEKHSSPIKIEVLQAGTTTKR